MYLTLYFRHIIFRHMDTTKQMLDILADAERKVRDVAMQLVEASEYDTLQRIAESARCIKELANSWKTNFASAMPLTRHTQTTASKPAQQPITQTQRRATKRGDYPMFFRQADSLLKIGWSKKEKAEYEHKAPRRAIDALAAAIVRRARNGKIFTSEDLFPLKDANDETETPGYQAYVALAWLKTARIVRQHGRRGYSVRNTDEMLHSIEAAWNRLESKP